MSPVKLKLQLCLQSGSSLALLQTNKHVSLCHISTYVAMATSCLPALYNYVGFHDVGSEQNNVV